MDSIPLHIFDYATLSRLCTLNKYWKHQVQIELGKRNRPSELMSYLRTVDTTKQKLFLSHFSQDELWGMFRSWWTDDDQYVYCVSPLCDTTHLNVLTSSVHASGMYINSSAYIYLGVLPLVVGDMIFGKSFEEVIDKAWNICSTLASEVDHATINDGKHVIWSAYNIHICKIDIVNKTLHETYPYVFHSVLQGIDDNNLGLELYGYTLEPRSSLENILLSLVL